MHEKPAGQRGLRAGFCDDGQGCAEKFRPDGLPAADSLAAVERQLHARAGG